MYSQKRKFEEILQSGKVLLVGSLAPEAQEVLYRKYRDKLGIDISGAIQIFEYEEIPKVKAEIADCNFDICFLAAGVNAVILADYIANELGKVAFDIGWGMKSMIDGKISSDSWIANHIGIENLFKM
jgi:hypothetical protein